MNFFNKCYFGVYEWDLLDYDFFINEGSRKWSCSILVLTKDIDSLWEKLNNGGAECLELEKRREKDYASYVCGDVFLSDVVAVVYSKHGEFQMRLSFEVEVENEVPELFVNNKIISDELFTFYPIKKTFWDYIEID